MAVSFKALKRHSDMLALETLDRRRRWVLVLDARRDGSGVGDGWMVVVVLWGMVVVVVGRAGQGVGSKSDDMHVKDDTK